VKKNLFVQVSQDKMQQERSAFERIFYLISGQTDNIKAVQETSKQLILQVIKKEFVALLSFKLLY
jgi:hypothetical protein